MALKKVKVPTKSDLIAGCIVKVPEISGIEFRLEYCSAMVPKLALEMDKKAAKVAWATGSDFYPLGSELEDICVWARFARTKDRWSLLGPTQTMHKHWFDKRQLATFKDWLQQVAALSGGCVFGSCYAGDITL